MKGMLEKELQRKIIKWLRNVGVFVVKQHGGVYTEVGIPDLICCYRGKFIAFELKVGNNNTTKIQDFKIKEIRKAGGKAEVIRDLDTVKKIIQKIKGDGENELERTQKKR